MKTRTLTLLRTRHATIHGESRHQGLYRCVCGVERWVRMKSTGNLHLKKCLCPPKPYLAATKKCTKCTLEKPTDQFFRDKRSGNPRPQCKACHAQGTARWTKRAPAASREKIRRASQRMHARTRFNLSVEAYLAALKSFGPTCMICDQPETRKGRTGLGLDHCHKTGRIRGALCTRCNSMLGMARDSPAILERAIRYLRAS